jgi:catechol 2,3-dioxygenase-like lactoylglutathione lyase family enzyme
MRPQLDAVQPVLMSRDVSITVRFYALLGFVPVFFDSAENPRYAVVRRDQVELHFQWQGPQQFSNAGDRPTYRFLLADVEGLYREFRDAGIFDNITPVSDTTWGTREFHVRDPDGNGLQFYRAL